MSIAHSLQDSGTVFIVCRVILPLASISVSLTSCLDLFLVPTLFMVTLQKQIQASKALYNYNYTYMILIVISLDIRDITLPHKAESVILLYIYGMWVLTGTFSFLVFFFVLSR